MIVEHFGTDKMTDIKPVANGSPSVKPSCGGLWTSPIESEYNWRQWCKDERYGVEKLSRSFQLKIKTDNLLYIDSYQDMYNKLIAPGHMYLYKECAPAIDFERLSKIYDGIWLTYKGEGEVRCYHPYYMYGWDCETVLLFNSTPIIEEISVSQKYK